MVQDTQIDVLVLGATGYTGRLVARYLSTHSEFLDNKFTFALGGRSKDKLGQIASELGISEERVPHVIVDVLDAGQVARAVQGVRVVANVVGPYWRWGKLVVKACAENGVHYIDLTGEPHFMKHVLTKCHSVAQHTKAVLIPCSGHDSIPADASAFISAQTLKRFGGPTTHVARSESHFLLKGGLSGGTVASAILAFEGVPKDDLMASTKNYSYAPELKGKPYPRPQLLYTLPLSNPPLHGGFYPMAPIDRLVVQRTWALLQSSRENTAVPAGEEEDGEPAPYGPDFVYDEYVSVPGRAASVVFSVVIFALGWAISTRPGLWLFKKVAPQPGEGPAEESLEKGRIKVTNVSSTALSASGGRQTHARTTIVGRGDPGYLLTSVMFAESALALALDHERLPVLAQGGGVLTPMSALGNVLLARMKKTGRWDIKSEIVKDEAVRARL